MYERLVTEDKLIKTRPPTAGPQVGDAVDETLARADFQIYQMDVRLETHNTDNLLSPKHEKQKSKDGATNT